MDSGMIGLVSDSIYKQYIWYFSEHSEQKQDFRAVDTTNSSVLYDLQDGNFLVTVVDSNGCKADSEIISITVSPTDAINFYDIKIFPNPVSDFLSVSTEKMLDNVKIEIYNDKGRLITRLESSLPGIISLQNTPPGIYFLKFTAGQKYFVTKVMKG